MKWKIYKLKLWWVILPPNFQYPPHSHYYREKMRTEKEIRNEITKLESIRLRFPEDSAIHLECRSQLAMLNWILKLRIGIPSPSEVIMNFLNLKENQRPQGGLIYIPK